MSFAKDAIGFYLSIEDQMSPVLERAVSNYEKFTSQLSKLNEKSYKQANAAMGKLTALVDTFDQLPKKAVKSYKKTLTELDKKMKPLTQKVGVVFTPKSERTFSQAIAKAVSKVLSKVTLRLTAAIPLRKVPGYDHSKSLRSAYKEMIQPPDMRGSFQGIPRFAEGGEVTGGQGKGIDDVLALLSKGEIVLPADIAEKLKAMAAASFDSAGAMGKAEEIDALTDVVAALVREMGKLKATNMDGEFDKATKSIDKMDDTMDDLTDTVEEADSAWGRFFQKTLGPAQFLAIQRSLDDLQRAFGGLSGTAQDAFGQVAGGQEPVLGFIESLNEANIKLNLSRDELAQWKADLLDLAAAAPDLGPQQIGQAFKALTDAGATSRDFLMQMSTLTAQIAETTGIGFDQAAEQVYRLGDAYGFTDEQIAEVFANVKATSSVTAISLEELSQQQSKNLDQLGAFLDTLGTADQKTKALVGLNQFAGAIAENWGEAGGAITDTFSQALAGNQEAMESLTTLGTSLQDVENAARAGDFTPILEDMVAHMRMMGEDSQFLAEVGELMKFQGTPAELSKMITSGGDMVAMLEQLRQQQVPTAESTAAMEEATKNVTTGFERFKRSVSGFLSSALGADTLEFFEDFNVQAAFATARLAQMAVEFGTAAVKAIFFRKASGGVVDTVSKTGGATKALGRTARGGKGVIGNFLAGIAQGIGAFGQPHVIAGVAVLTGALLGIAAAARIAEPVLESMFGVFERLAGKTIEMFERVFTTLTELDPKHALATAASMLALGPALSGLGTGLMIFGNTALLGVPGLIAFSKAIKFMSDETGENPLATAINRLFDMFQFDDTKMKRAIRSITGAALFMGELAAVTVAFGIMKTAAFLQKANPLEGLAQVFGEGSLTEMLVGQSKTIIRTVDGLAEHYGSVSTSLLTKLEKAAPTFDAVGSFFATYAKISAAYAGVKFTAAAGKLLETYVQAFTKKTGFMVITDEADSIIRTVRVLADKFTTTSIDVKGLEDTMPVFETTAKFLEGYAGIVETFDKIKPGAIERVSEFYLDYYGIDSPLQALGKDLNTIISTIKQVSAGFYLLDQDVGEDVIAGAGKGIEKAVGMLSQFRPVLEASEDLSAMAEALRGGFWADLWDAISGEEAPLEALKNVFIDDEQGIIGVVSEITTFLAGRAGFIEGANVWDGIGKYYEGAQVGLNRVRKITDGLTAVAEGFDKLSELSTVQAVGTATVQSMESVILMIGGLGRKMAAIGELPVLEEMAQKADRVKRIADALRSATLAGIQLSQADLMPEFEAPMTTKAELERVVRVELDPNTTDRPVLSATQESNMLLAQILSALQQGGARQARPSTPGAVRPTDERVRALAGGED